jgi:hypothetical protein
VGQGQAERAEAILAQLAPEGVPDTMRAALACTRALNLHWGLGRPAEAEAVLTATAATITDRACRDELACLRAKFLQYAGWGADAVNLASDVRGRPDATDVAVSDSLVVLCQSLTGLGKHEQAIAAGERSAAFEGRRQGASWSMAEHEVVSGRCAGYLWGDGWPTPRHWQCPVTSGRSRSAGRWAPQCGPCGGENPVGRGEG